MNKILLLFVICFLELGCLPDKSSISYKPVSISNKSKLRENYIKYSQEILDIKDDWMSYTLFKRNFNLKKLDEINDVIRTVIPNYDVFRLYSSGAVNYLTASISTPQIIIGTVEKQNIDTSEISYSRLEWRVNVKEIIADDGEKIVVQNGDDLFVKGVGMAISCANLPRLFEGQEVLLWLKPLKEASNRRFISSDAERLNRTDLDKVFTIIHALNIENRTVFSGRQKIGGLREIKKQIKQLIKINNRNQFYADFRDAL